MALFRCTGGGFKQELVWTNDNPGFGRDSFTVQGKQGKKAVGWVVASMNTPGDLNIDAYSYVPVPQPPVTKVIAGSVNYFQRTVTATETSLTFGQDTYGTAGRCVPYKVWEFYKDA